MRLSTTSEAAGFLQRISKDELHAAVKNEREGPGDAALVGQYPFCTHLCSLRRPTSFLQRVYKDNILATVNSSGKYSKGARYKRNLVEAYAQAERGQPAIVRRGVGQPLHGWRNRLYI